MLSNSFASKRWLAQKRGPRPNKKMTRNLVVFMLNALFSMSPQEPCPADVNCRGTQRFMEHGNIKWSDERAVLDHLADSFRRSRDQLIYFLIYPGLSSCHDEARLRAMRAKKYLVQHHKISGASILWKRGSVRQDLSVEIWLLPKDKPLPEPSTSVTIDPSQIHLRRRCKLT